ncbi:MAG: FAD-dependent oxidoreductase [Synergistaceae bacterium]|jgi:glycerol-3-phosphate dehydrogenase|nr:FAD-dependent oxidoreductase [Synergistaceae bacterium]
MSDLIREFNEALRADERLGRYEIEAALERPGVIELRGIADSWKDATDIGFLASGMQSVKNVVNRIETPVHKRSHSPEDVRQRISGAESIGTIAKADVVVIGCGVSGAAAARTLAMYDLDIIVVDKAHDVSEGTTKANNGMIHSGHDPKHGTLKAEMNVKGNAMYTQWAEELDFDLTRPGMLLSIFDEKQDKSFEAMYENALKNGVPGVRIISNEEAHKIEPRLNVDVRRALWTPTAGFVEPYEVVLALMENAIENGVKLMLKTEVLDVKVSQGSVSSVVTNRGVIETSLVINAAGLYADEIADMVGDMFYTIHPRKGTLLIFDKRAGDRSTDTNLSTMPSAHSKGGGNMKTPTGNPLWGPSAKEIPDKDNLEVDQDELDELFAKVFTEGIEPRDIVTFFSGVRAPVYSEDFIVEASERVKGFIHVAGIQSPGLASSPAISARVRDIVLDIMPETALREKYNPRRRANVKFSRLNRTEQDALVAENPAYGHIICRCETVSEGEVVDAIRGVIPAVSMDAVKRRTRCGMGRCGGGFCGPRVMEIIARETDTPYWKVPKRNLGSEMLTADNRPMAED